MSNFYEIMNLKFKNKAKILLFQWVQGRVDIFVELFVLRFITSQKYLFILKATELYVYSLLVFYIRYEQTRNLIARYRCFHNESSH